MSVGGHGPIQESAKQSQVVQAFRPAVPGEPEGSHDTSSDSVGRSAVGGYSPDKRRPAAIGRHARMDLVFAYRRGRTVLTHAYAEPPFRIGRSLDAGPYAYVILACTGPGVFVGDTLHTHVRVERGARVLRASQAALQVHPAAKAQAATIASDYEVEDDGELDCLWDPVIPFANARLTQRIALQIASGSRVFWSDALMSGRTGRGERWRFHELGHELRLTVDGSLAYLERYRLTSPSPSVTRPWMAASAHYLGTTIVHEHATAARAEEIQRQLDAIGEIRAGVDCVAPHLLVGRLLSTRGPQFAAARAAFRQTFVRPPMRRG